MARAERVFKNRDSGIFLISMHISVDILLKVTLFMSLPRTFHLSDNEICLITSFKFMTVFFRVSLYQTEPTFQILANTPFPGGVYFQHNWHIKCSITSLKTF